MLEFVNGAYWFEVAVVMAMFAIGNMFFHHFEERTPVVKRLLKMFFFTVFSVFLAWQFGHVAFVVFLGLMMTLVGIIHGWYLPSKGINGWTGEPREKYYEWRGWSQTSSDG